MSRPASSCARIASSVASSCASGEERLCNAPELPRAHARREAPGELLAVDQPLGLRDSCRRAWSGNSIQVLRRIWGKSCSAARGRCARSSEYSSRRSRAARVSCARGSGRTSRRSRRPPRPASRRSAGAPLRTPASASGMSSVLVAGPCQRNGVLHREARARADGEMRGAQRVADQHHVARGPARVAHVREVAPDGLVRDEAVALAAYRANTRSQ